MPSLTTSLGVSNEVDLPTVKELIDTHNENKQLRSELNQTTSSLKLLVDYIALSNPDFNGLSENQKYIIAKEHDMKLTTVESQLKARRKKFAQRRRTLHRKYKYLNRSTAMQNHSSFSGVRRPQNHRWPTSQSSKARRRHYEQIRRCSSSSVSSDESQSTAGEESTSVQGSDTDNILPPVIIHQVLDESIRIKVHGRLLTQKRLAEFYQARGLDERGKRLNKNIEMNEMRKRTD